MRVEVRQRDNVKGGWPGLIWPIMSLNSLTGPILHCISITQLYSPLIAGLSHCYMAQLTLTFRNSDNLQISVNCPSTTQVATKYTFLLCNFILDPDRYVSFKYVMASKNCIASKMWCINLSVEVSKSKVQPLTCAFTILLKEGDI